MADGKIAEAEQFLVPPWKMLKATLGPEHPVTLSAAHMVAQLYYYQDKFDEAEALLKSVQAAYRRLQGEAGTDTLDSTNSLAVLYMDRGKLEDAERLLEQVIPKSRQHMGSLHPNTLNAMNNLGMVYRSLKRNDDAASIWSTVVEGRRSILGKAHHETLASLALLGELYAQSGKYELAEPLLEEAIEGCRLSLDRNHETTDLVLAGFSEMYAGKGDLKKLESVLVESAGITRLRYGPESGAVAGANSSTALLFFMEKKYSDAIPYFRDALLFKRKNSPTNFECYQAESRLGFCLLESGAYAESEKLLLSGYKGMAALGNKASPAIQAARGWAFEQLKRLYAVWPEPGRPRDWQMRLLDAAFPMNQLVVE
jgi:tetratricopeptide (TPR) repeat protein